MTNSQYVNTDVTPESDISDAPLRLSTNGGISRGFALESGIVRWRNSAFSANPGSFAGYCIRDSVLRVVFDDTNKSDSCAQAILFVFIGNFRD